MARAGQAKNQLKVQHKGLQTRGIILDAALHMAAQLGLEGLSLGLLAEQTSMSKSGVFAHFGSREDLQIAVIREYHTRFKVQVFDPAMRQPRGLPRLEALFKAWLHYIAQEIDSGCIYISGAVEFDDKPGAVRDALVDMVRVWRDALTKAVHLAVEQGHLLPGTDAAQLSFELQGLVLAVHHDARLLGLNGTAQRAHLGFERLVAAYSNKAA